MLDVAELDDLSGTLLLAVLIAIIHVVQGDETALLFSVSITAFTILVKLALFITGCYLFSHCMEPGFTGSIASGKT